MRINTGKVFHADKIILFDETELNDTRVAFTDGFLMIESARGLDLLNVSAVKVIEGLKEIKNEKPIKNHDSIYYF